ncbi:MAG: Ig-like domain-containing protein [Candidatus Sericytochromatia bacterium]
MNIKKLLVTGMLCSVFIPISACEPGKSGDNYVPATALTTALKDFNIFSPVTSLAVGNSAKMLVVATQANGSTIANAPVSWAVSDERFAKIDKDGNLTALADGVVLVTGKVGTKTSSATITITKLPEFSSNTTKESQEPTIKANPTLIAQIKNIVLKLENETNPKDKNVAYTLDAIEAQTKFVAIAYNQDNKPLDGIPFTWISSDANVASVNNKGIVTANTTGSTNLIVTAGDKLSNIVKVVVPGGKANINVSFQGD